MAITKHVLREWMLLLAPPSRRSWSQYAEDLVIQDLAREIGKAMPTTYIDVGANHPKRFSNTYGLYMQGWKGLVIEPNSELCAMYRYSRPRDIVVNCAVGRKPESKQFFRFSASELNTFDERSAAKYLTWGARLVGQTEVAVRPLTEIVEECEVIRGGGVGLLSIDAEGMDFEILQGLDFTRCRPKLVAVEVDPESALATQELMRSAGYRSRARLFNTEIWISGEP